MVRAPRRRCRRPRGAELRMSGFTEWLNASIVLTTDAVPVALNQTLQLVFIPFVFVIAFGIPLGVVLYVTSAGGLSPVRWLNSTLGVIVNVTRSLPFLVLVIGLWPLGGLLVGFGPGLV